MALSDEKYILLTTFRKDGSPVGTATWVVPLDGGELGLWTSSGSGKVKRLANSGRVTLQPSDARGRVRAGTEPTDGTARVVTGGEYESIRAKVTAKYGVMVPLTRVLGTVGGLVKGKRIPYGDVGIVIATAG